MRAPFLFLAFLVISAGGSATAQDRPSPATLSGLKSVFLQVYAGRGLEQSMTAFVEATLKAAGIALVSDKEWQSTQDTGRGLHGHFDPVRR